MCFFCFMLDYLLLFSTSIALMLSWCNLSSSTAYPCLSIKYLGHMHCGKASSATTISDYVDPLPFIFCFPDSSIIDPDPMGIIAPLRPLKYGCLAQDISTHHLTTLRLSSLSVSGRCRVLLMYLSTIKIFQWSSSSEVLTRLHRKAMSILMSFLYLDVTNSICATVWCNTFDRSSFSSIHSSSCLT